MKLTESALRKIIKEELEESMQESKIDIHDEAWEIIFDLMNLHLIPSEGIDERRLEWAHKAVLKRIRNLISNTEAK